MFYLPWSKKKKEKKERRIIDLAKVLSVGEDKRNDKQALELGNRQVHVPRDNSSISTSFSSFESIYEYT